MSQVKNQVTFVSCAYYPVPAMIIVLKVGGNILSDELALAALLDAFVSLKESKVLVHGGGKKATEIADQMGIKTTMVEGRRVTDDAMLDIVTMVYGGLMNKKVVANLQARGQNALGLTGADLNLIQAHKREVKSIDYGWAGDIDQVQVEKILPLIGTGVSPVLAPLTHNGHGQLLNTNADTIASSVAVALSQHEQIKLIYSFEKPGVLADPDNDDSVIPMITPASYLSLKQQGIVSGGMIPKLDNAFDALHAGVQEVIICQATAVAYLGTEQFIGTRITL